MMVHIDDAEVSKGLTAHVLREQGWKLADQLAKEMISTVMPALKRALTLASIEMCAGIVVDAESHGQWITSDRKEQRVDALRKEYRELLGVPEKEEPPEIPEADVAPLNPLPPPVATQPLDKEDIPF